MWTYVIYDVSITNEVTITTKENVSKTNENSVTEKERGSNGTKMT